MSDPRVAEGALLGVSVGLISGGLKTGRLAAFEPEAPVVTLSMLTRGPKGGLTTTETTLPVEALAYVAFHEQANATPPARTAAHRKVTLHFAGGKRLDVLADATKRTEEPGFYAIPSVKGERVREYFCYAHAVRAREACEPLGELLVEQGLIDRNQLDRGLDEQTAQRNAPIGQILVEHDAVKPEDVDAAAARQQIRRGGRPMRLGEVLVEAGLATEEDIEAAIGEQKRRRGKRLGEVLVEMGLVDEFDVARTLAKKFELPFVDLDEAEVEPEAANVIPAGLIERYRVFPFAQDETTISIAMADPLAMEALDMLRFSLGRKIVEYMAAPGQLQSYLEPYLVEDDDGPSEGVDDLLDELGSAAKVVDTPSAVTVASEEDSAVAKLVNRIIIDATRRSASDIHVEPNGEERPALIRYRVDGSCSTYKRIPPAVRNQLVARIKIMASLDIAERRKPQDGKIKFRLGKKDIELRVATIPTVGGGEDVVMRILAGAGGIPFDDLGLSARNDEVARKLVTQPYGLILVVGPTGSGKTTTLHSMLGLINTEDRKIWTAEDPVEITQPGLRQVQTHAKIGFNFANAMRAFLRADPDVIMVGEMRDLETASTGVEASLTGHLVFSTLHTNNAPETVTRLLDMGLDPFTFADSLLGVLAQRLARRLCSDCKEPHTPTATELAELEKWNGGKLEGADINIHRASGCSKCGETGYRGRCGLHELLSMNDDLKEAVQRRAPAAAIRELAMAGGMRTLLQDGVDKCLSGTTDLHSVLAVCAR